MYNGVPPCHGAFLYSGFIGRCQINADWKFYKKSISYYRKLAFWVFCQRFSDIDHDDVDPFLLSCDEKVFCKIQGIIDLKKFVSRSYLALVYGLLYLPILILIFYSFNQAKYSTVWQGFSVKWYLKLLKNPLIIDAFFNSIAVAAISSVIACMLGTLCALIFYRYRFKGIKIMHSMLYCIIMSPDIVMGISLLMVFVILGIHPGFLTLLLSHITFCFPFVAVTVYARLSGFDPAVIDAAKDLGATEFEIFYKVILPMSMPAVIAGWLLSFTLSLDDVVVSFFVTGPGFEILPLKIYSMVRLGVKPEVNALCSVLFLLTLVAVMAAHFLIKEKSK